MLVSRLLRVVALSLLAAMGCMNETGTRPAGGSGSAPAAGGKAQSEYQPPEDRSPPLNDYLQAGMPAPDRAWSGEDMKRAAQVLAAMEEEKRGRLPRYESPNSGTLLRRLVAQDNLDYYRNRSIPLELRLPDSLTYAEFAGRITKLYLDSYNRGEAGDSELVELMGGHLRTTVAQLRLMEEFLPSLDPKDPTYSIRIDGLNRAKASMATVVAGALTTMTEANAYRTSELKRLAGSLEATLPDILPALSEASRTETLVRLRIFAGSPSMRELKPELEKVLNAAEASAR